MDRLLHKTTSATGMVMDNGKPGATLAVEATSGTATQKGAAAGVWFDRSQARLRVPVGEIDETLRIANNLRFESVSLEGIDEVDHNLLARLKDAAVIERGVFHPIADALLTTVNQASLMITIDLRYGTDSSNRVLWATPRDAALSNEIGDGTIEIVPAEIPQLPSLLGQLALVGSPRYVGEAPISIGTDALSEAERFQPDAEKALQALGRGGLSPEQARIVLSFQGQNVRRWRIASAWSSKGGQQSAELRGIDAGADGQWLAAMTGSRDGRGQLTFTPQGHGELMRALRAVLPKVWDGTPLKAPSL